MGTGNNVVAPAPVRTEDEDIITSRRRRSTYRNASDTLGLCSKLRVPEDMEWDYYTNIITGVESPYGIDPVFESEYNDQRSSNR